MIGRTVSHYKILEKLGEGGVEVVYKAQDLKLDRPVALKLLPPDLTRDPEAKRWLVHDATAASALLQNASVLDTALTRPMTVRCSSAWSTPSVPINQSPCDESKSVSSSRRVLQPHQTIHLSCFRIVRRLFCDI